MRTIGETRWSWSCWSVGKAEKIKAWTKEPHSVMHTVMFAVIRPEKLLHYHGGSLYSIVVLCVLKNSPVKKAFVWITVTISLEGCQAIIWPDMKSWAKNLFLSFQCPVLAIISNSPSMKSTGEKSPRPKIFSLNFHLNILKNFTEKPHPFCNERCGFPNANVYRRQRSKGFHCLQGNRALFRYMQWIFYLFMLAEAALFNHIIPVFFPCHEEKIKQNISPSTSWDFQNLVLI